jgi:hypothetical protein
MNVAAADPEGQAQVAAFLHALQQLDWSEGRNVGSTPAGVKAFNCHRKEIEQRCE